MCKYSILTQSNKGIVRFCHDCKAYSLNFNNIVMNFDERGFERFKINVEKCYEEHSKTPCHRDLRNIFFNTKVEGLQLVFTTIEVGELLSLMQTASLESIGVVESEHNDF